MELLKIGLNELQENQEYITEIALNENINIYTLVDEIFKSADENGGLVSEQTATEQIKNDYDLKELMEQMGVAYDYILSDTIKEFFEDCKKSLGRYGNEEHFINVFNDNIKKCFDDMDENYYNEEVKECYFDDIQDCENYFYKINGILQKDLINLNTLKVGA